MLKVYNDAASGPYVPSDETEHARYAEIMGTFAGFMFLAVVEGVTINTDPLLLANAGYQASVACLAIEVGKFVASLFDPRAYPETTLDEAGVALCFGGFASGLFLKMWNTAAAVAGSAAADGAEALADASVTRLRAQVSREGEALTSRLNNTQKDLLESLLQKPDADGVEPLGPPTRSVLRRVTHRVSDGSLAVTNRYDGPLLLVDSYARFRGRYSLRFYRQLNARLTGPFIDLEMCKPTWPNAVCG